MRNFHILTNYDPGLTPSNAGLPPGLMNWLRDLGSGVMGAVLIILGVALVVGAAIWAIGKWGSGGSRMQTAGGWGIVTVLAAAFLVGATSALIKFFGETGGTVIGHAIDFLPELGQMVTTAVSAFGT